MIPAGPSREQIRDHVRRGITLTLAKKPMHAKQLVAASNDGWLDRVPAQLRVPRTRKQAVAETAATDRVGDCTAFRDVRVDGFGGAAVDEPSGVRSHWRAQISNVADALSLRVIGAIVKRYDLERVACW